MKKTIFVMCAAAALFVSCKEENPVNFSGDTVRFIAETETAKSVLASDSKKINWAENDFLAVYSNSTVNKFTYNKTSKVFTGTADKTGDIYAVYPYLQVKDATAALKFTKNGTDMVVDTYIPSCQDLTAGSFAMYSCLSAGKAHFTGDEIKGTMKNACGFLKFTVSQASTTPITKVIFSVTEKKHISGWSKLTISEDGDVSLDCKENRFVECSVVNKASSANFANGTYYATVAPTDFTNGIIVTMYGADGKVYEYKTKAFTLGRNEVANLGTIDSSLATDLTSRFVVRINFKFDTCGLPVGTKVTTETPASIKIDGKDYDFKVKGVKCDTSYALMDNNDSYITSPVIEGKTLKRVISTSRGHTANYCSSMKVYTASDKKTALTGVYYCCNNNNLSFAGAYNNTYCNYTSASKPGYISHIFDLGKCNDAEGSTTVVSPEAGVPYYFLNGGSNYLLQAVDFIYE